MWTPEKQEQIVLEGGAWRLPLEGHRDPLAEKEEDEQKEEVEEEEEEVEDEEKVKKEEIEKEGGRG